VGTHLAQRRMRRRVLWHEVMPTFTLVRGNGRKRAKCGDSWYCAWCSHGGRRRYVGVAYRTVRLGISSGGNRLKLVDRGRGIMKFMVAVIRLGGEVTQGTHRRRRRHRTCGWYLCRRPARHGRIGRVKVRVLGSLGLCSHIVSVLTMSVL